MNKRICVSVFLVVMPLLLPLMSEAKQVSGLYEASFPVASQSVAEREKAVGEGFRQVLVKVSGQSGILQSPALKEALADPGGYLAEFSYEAVSKNGGASAVTGQARKRLRLKYDHSGVQSLLRSKGFPVWSSNRPSLLIWWVEESDNQRFFVNADFTPGVVADFERAAGKRGVPLLFPLLDIQDGAKLSASEVWGGFYEGVGDVSLRYGTPVFLAGRSRFVDGQWRLRYSLNIGGQFFSGENASNSKQKAINAVVNDVADTLGKRLGKRKVAGASTTLGLRVEGVDDFSVYSELLGVISKVSGVRSVQVSRVEGENIWLDLTYSGSRASVLDAIETDRRLRAIPYDESESGFDDSEAGIIEMSVEESTVGFRWSER